MFLFVLDKSLLLANLVECDENHETRTILSALRCVEQVVTCSCAVVLAMLSDAQHAVACFPIFAKAAAPVKPSKSCANERSIASRQSILSSLAYFLSESFGEKRHQMIVGDRLKDGVHRSSFAQGPSL
jgi:hypothetical protein